MARRDYLVQTISTSRRAPEQRFFLALAVSGSKPLEGIPHHAVAVVALVDREIAFEQRAFGPKGLNTRLDIGPPDFGQLLRAGRRAALLEIVPEDMHPHAAKFDVGVGIFTQLLDVFAPFGKYVVAPEGVGTDSERCADMVDHDSCVGKLLRKIGQFRDLMVIDP